MFWPLICPMVIAGQLSIIGKNQQINVPLEIKLYRVGKNAAKVSMNLVIH